MESAQVGVVNIETLPIALSADVAEIVERNASLKFEKKEPHPEIYEVWLPHGTVIGIVLLTLRNTSELNWGATLLLEVILCSLMQFQNALNPIEVTELGMMMVYSMRQPVKA